jgi:hypothetical protein
MPLGAACTVAVFIFTARVVMPLLVCRYITAAADKHLPHAILALGKFHGERKVPGGNSRGKQPSQDLVKALECYTRAAKEHSLGEAMYRVGCAKQKGVGCAQSHSEAVHWFEMCTDPVQMKRDQVLLDRTRTHPNNVPGWSLDAMFNLGVIYHGGEADVPRDYATAIRWWEMGTQYKSASCTFNLGMVHRLGLGVAVNERVATDYFMRAHAINPKLLVPPALSATNEQQQQQNVPSGGGWSTQKAAPVILSPAGRKPTSMARSFSGSAMEMLFSPTIASSRARSSSTADPTSDYNSVSAEGEGTEAGGELSDSPRDRLGSPDLDWPRSLDEVPQETLMLGVVVAAVVVGVALLMRRSSTF